MENEDLEGRVTMEFDRAELQALARRSRPLNSLIEMDVDELRENARRTAPRAPRAPRPWKWAIVGSVLGAVLVVAYRLLTTP